MAMIKCPGCEEKIYIHDLDEYDGKEKCTKCGFEIIKADKEKYKSITSNLLKQFIVSMIVVVLIFIVGVTQGTTFLGMLSLPALALSGYYILYISKKYFKQQYHLVLEKYKI